MRNILIVVGLLALLGGGYWYYTWSVISASASSAEEHPYTVIQTTLKETLTLSGRVDAEEKVTLAFQTGGRLATVNVKEGDYIQKGQPIASLDQRDVQKRLEQNLNNYMTTRWDFDQTKQDNKDAPYRDGDLGDRMKRLIDKAQFSLDNSVIAVELQALAKEYSSLTAPIEGVVTHMEAPYAGVNIGPTTTFDIVNPATIYFAAVADQTEVPQLMVGQTAQVTLDPYPDEQMLATIRSIAFTPRAGETGIVYEVKMAFVTDNVNLKYRIGMTGDVDFITKQRTRILAVPVQYVKTESAKKYVTQLIDGKKIKTEVQVGEEGDSQIEIKSGLQVGDVVVETK